MRRGKAEGPVLEAFLLEQILLVLNITVVSKSLVGSMNILAAQGG